MYKFQIDISSNSREIKYQNIGRTHRHTDTQTDRVKTIPRNPLRGRAKLFEIVEKSSTLYVINYGSEVINYQQIFSLMNQKLIVNINY